MPTVKQAAQDRALNRSSVPRVNTAHNSDGVVCHAIDEYFLTHDLPETREEQEKAGREIAVNVRAMDRDTEYMQEEGLL